MGERDAVLVTGAAGFIGSHVVEALCAQGRRVVGVDNFDPFYSRPRKERNAQRCRASGCEIVEGDLCDATFLTSLLKRARPAAHRTGCPCGGLDRVASSPGPLLLRERGSDRC